MRRSLHFPTPRPQFAGTGGPSDRPTSVERAPTRANDLENAAPTPPGGTGTCQGAAETLPNLSRAHVPRPLAGRQWTSSACFPGEFGKCRLAAAGSVRSTASRGRHRAGPNLSLCGGVRRHLTKHRAASVIRARTLRDASASFVPPVDPGRIAHFAAQHAFFGAAPPIGWDRCVFGPPHLGGTGSNARKRL